MCLNARLRKFNDKGIFRNKGRASQVKKLQASINNYVEDPSPSSLKELKDTVKNIIDTIGKEKNPKKSDLLTIAEEIKVELNSYEKNLQKSEVEDYDPNEVTIKM